MKYYICVLAIILLSLTAGAALAQTTASSLDVPVPSSFGISGATRAIDNGSNELSPGPGSIEIIHVDQALYLRVPAPARAGTRLASLSDPESGLVFRNNTMQLPVSRGTKAGALIAITDGLVAEGDAYAGLITGLELDTAKVTTIRNDTGFTAGAAILLKDLPAGASYRLSFSDGDDLPGEIAADLEAAGLTAAAFSPAFEVSGDSLAAKDAAGFVAATLRVGDDWPGRYGEKNVTFYSVSGGQLYRLPFSAIRAADGSVTYQAMAPGTGTFVLLATAPRGPAVPTREGTSLGDVAVLGGALAVLVIALAVMVRRVAKR